MWRGYSNGAEESCGVVRSRAESCGVGRAEEEELLHQCGGGGVVRSRSAKHSFEFMMRRNLHPRMLKNEHFCQTLNETVDM